MSLALLESLVEILAGVIVVVLILSIIWLVFYYVGMWKFYEKAGQEGWKCIVPFYNTYVLAVDMAGLKWYWFAINVGGSLLSFIPFIGFLFSLASLFASVNIFYCLSKKLNKDTLWIVLTTLFGFITLPILGFASTTTWNQKVQVDPDGFLPAMLNKNSSTEETKKSK